MLYDTNAVYKCIYMEFRNMVTITLYVRQQERHKCIEQSFGLCGGGGARWVGGSGWGTHVHPWGIHVDVWQNQYNIVK